MIKKLIIGFLWIYATIANAQNKSDIDSLYQVKNFLLEIRSTVNTKEWKGKQQLNKITKLMEQGIVYEKQFPLWLKTVINPDSWHYTEMKRQFILIMQTVALYQSDLKTTRNKQPKNQEDLKFLNTRIPPLVDNIYYYCKLAEEERLKKIH